MVNGNAAHELLVREAAVAWVLTRAERSGGVVTRVELEAFRYEGEPIKLIDQSRGIRNPRQLAATISVPEPAERTVRRCGDRGRAPAVRILVRRSTMPSGRMPSG